MADGEPDWVALGVRMNSIQAEMIHAENTELRGTEFTAEALRRLFADTPFTVRHAGDFIPRDEHMRVLEMNRKVDRANGEAAQEKLRELRESYRDDLAAACAGMGRRLRKAAETVRSKRERDGVLMAAGWLDPEGGEVRDVG